MAPYATTCAMPSSVAPISISELLFRMDALPMIEPKPCAHVRKIEEFMGEEYRPRKESLANKRDRGSRSAAARNRIVSALRCDQWMQSCDIAQVSGLDARSIRGAMNRNYMTPLVIADKHVINGRLHNV